MSTQSGRSSSNTSSSRSSIAAVWRAWLADRRLNGLLQADADDADPVERFKAGAIVPEEGTTLLVDYGPPDGTIATHHAGHAVYTGTKWLLFHAEEVARQLYSPSMQRVT